MRISSSLLLQIVLTALILFVAFLSIIMGKVSILSYGAMTLVYLIAEVEVLLRRYEEENDND